MTKNNNTFKANTFKERLDKVEKSIGSKKVSREAPSFKHMAYRASADMMAAIGVGCGIGIALEHFFPLKPWGMIIGFFLGATTGLLNVYRGLVKIGYGLKLR
jgi:F0F1-type ATP synthase assembly protein I